MLIHIQNQKGGEFKTIENAGFGRIVLNEQDCITVDEFEGVGKNYKKREQREIKIYVRNEELFCGTILELREQLKQVQKVEKFKIGEKFLRGNNKIPMTLISKCPDYHDAFLAKTYSGRNYKNKLVKRIVMSISEEYLEKNIASGWIVKA